MGWSEITQYENKNQRQFQTQLKQCGHNCTPGQQKSLITKDHNSVITDN